MIYLSIDGTKAGDLHFLLINGGVPYAFFLPTKERYDFFGIVVVVIAKVFSRFCWNTMRNPQSPSGRTEFGTRAVQRQKFYLFGNMPLIFPCLAVCIIFSVLIFFPSNLQFNWKLFPAFFLSLHYLLDLVRSAIKWGGLWTDTSGDYG